MKLTLELEPDLEKRLTRAAVQQALPVDKFAIQIIENHLPLDAGRAQLISLLQSWIDEAPEGKPENGDDLERAVDEDRLSDRKIFPPELHGVTW